MLKASEVKMMDGHVYNGVDLIPSDDGFVLLVDEKVIQIMHHAVASIFAAIEICDFGGKMSEIMLVPLLRVVRRSSESGIST